MADRSQAWQIRATHDRRMIWPGPRRTGTNLPVAVLGDSQGRPFVGTRTVQLQRSAKAFAFSDAAVRYNRTSERPSAWHGIALMSITT